MNGNLKTGIFLIGATLALMIPAFINGYPIVYSDTSTYIASGFDLEAPFDRPMTYGLFLRIFSLNGISLWPVIGFQSLLLSVLLFRVIREVFNGWKHNQTVGFIIILSLSLLTSVSWITSQVMPDIFTAIMILSAALLLQRTTKNSARLLLYPVFFLATAMHISHLTINIVFFAGILLMRETGVLQLKPRIRVRPVSVMIALSFAAILTMGSALSKSKHIFLMGAFVEHGIAKKYLDENCDLKNYKLCAYKDSLPEKAWQFIWEDTSPLYKIGGWKETKDEFNEIILNTLTSPRYLLLHMKESGKAMCQQLIRFRIGDGSGAFLSETLLFERIGQYFPQELQQFEFSRQNQKRIGYLNWLNTLQQIIVVASVIGPGILLIIKRRALKNHAFLTLGMMILWSILINAWVCGTFANAIDRLGSKMIWLVPMLAFISLLLIIMDWRKNDVRING